MVYGIIDLGSNTIRLSIFKYEDGKIRLLQNKKAIAGLAACVEGGGLTEIGISKACFVLNRYKDILKAQNIENYSVFATASLRNINNREIVLNEIKERTGIVPEVLFGDEEARLDFIGVKNSCELSRGVLIDINREIVLNEIKERTGIVPEVLFGDEEARLDFIGVKNSCELSRGVLIDIGGGSTELVLFENGEIKRLTSIPIGALNLQNKSVKGIIATDRELKKMKKIINKELVLFENGEIKRLTSIPIGALNLQNKSVKGIIATDRELKKMKKIINNALDELQWNFESNYETMYAIGGSSRAALEISKELFKIPAEERSFNRANVKEILNRLKSSDVKDYKAVYKIKPERIFSLSGGLVILNEERSFNRANVKEILNRLKSSDVKDYKAVYKIKPERIFSLSGGLVILNEVIKRFGCEVINISKDGIREGYFIDRIIDQMSDKEENNEK